MRGVGNVKLLARVSFSLWNTLALAPLPTAAYEKKKKKKKKKKEKKRKTNAGCLSNALARELSSLHKTIASALFNDNIDQTG